MIFLSAEPSDNQGQYSQIPNNFATMQIFFQTGSE
jgi:hypothetical protein